MFTHTGPRRGDVFAESSFAKQIAMAENGLTENKNICWKFEFIENNIRCKRCCKSIFHASYCKSSFW